MLAVLKITIKPWHRGRMLEAALITMFDLFMNCKHIAHAAWIDMNLTNPPKKKTHNTHTHTPTIFSS